MIPAAVGALPANTDSAANPPEPGKGVRFIASSSAPARYTILSLSRDGGIPRTLPSIFPVLSFVQNRSTP